MVKRPTRHSTGRTPSRGTKGGLLPVPVDRDGRQLPRAPEGQTRGQGLPSTQEYELTEQEYAVVDAWLDWHKQASPVPPINVETSTPSVCRISLNHPDQDVAKVLLAHALGTHDVELAYVLLDQLGNVARTGKVLTAKEFNGIISIVRGICPRDPTEALLAAQMAAIHNATMVAARRMNNADNLPQQDSASNMLNKLARTFTAQIEALKKYRSDGEQTVKVQRVNVNDGGQAIIGNVTTQGGGGATKNQRQSHGPSIAPTSGPALLGDLETNRVSLPGSGGTRQEGVPVPRSTSGRAKRPR
jgi:hypothetical protein